MLQFRSLFLSFVADVLAASLAGATAVDLHAHGIEARQSTNSLVFCHFMIGITSDRTSAADYDADMQRAKALGIDAFALNIGVDPYTDTQLGYAYQSAASNGMKVFISFDFNWWSTGQASDIGNKIKQYASLPAQLMYDKRVFVSSFAGDGLDVTTMRSTSGLDLFFAPNYHPGQGNFADIDGALNWMAWPNDGNNKAPRPGANVTVEQGDAAYAAALNGKPYIAPVSAWFSTHYGPEVSYSKNWVFPGDLLWWDRWNEILTMKPQFLEIITWNDYGESHYIGPLSSKHTDDGASKWVNDMPHDGWLDMAKPFIAAYHAGATDVSSYITSDQLVYWYRQNLKNLNCDATDTTSNQPANNASGNYFEGKPDGWDTLQDSVFVVSLLRSAGTLTVTSGGNSQTINAPAGAAAFSVPMALGQQSFSLSRSGTSVLGGTSLKDITDTCVCGLYNFNAYVGALPAESADPLGPDGLASLTQGLHVTTCSPTPSLGTASTRIVTTSITTPVSSSGITTSTIAPTSFTTSSVTAPIPTSASQTTVGLHTITASSELFPTNCMQKGDVWDGPPGTDSPDYCDG